MHCYVIASNHNNNIRMASPAPPLETFITISTLYRNLTHSMTVPTIMVFMLIIIVVHKNDINNHNNSGVMIKVSLPQDCRGLNHEGRFCEREKTLSGK